MHGPVNPLLHCGPRPGYKILGRLGMGEAGAGRPRLRAGRGAASRPRGGSRRRRRATSQKWCACPGFSPSLRTVSGNSLLPVNSTSQPGATILLTASTACSGVSMRTAYSDLARPPAIAISVVTPTTNASVRCQPCFVSSPLSSSSRSIPTTALSIILVRLLFQPTPIYCAGFTLRAISTKAANACWKHEAGSYWNFGFCQWKKRCVYARSIGTTKSGSR